MSERFDDVILYMTAHEAGSAEEAYFDRFAWRELIDRLRAAHQREVEDAKSGIDPAFANRKPLQPKDMIWPTAYNYIKQAFCHVHVCRNAKPCERCRFSELRTYAARDCDLFHSAWRLLKAATAVVERIKANHPEAVKSDDALRNLVETFDVQTEAERQSNARWTGDWPTAEEVQKLAERQAKKS